MPIILIWAKRLSMRCPHDSVAYLDIARKVFRVFTGVYVAAKHLASLGTFRIIVFF